MWIVSRIVTSSKESTMNFQGIESSNYAQTDFILFNYDERIKIPQNLVHKI
jgi:hypothetical protein